MSVPKEKTRLVKNEFPKQKFQVLLDFELKILQRVRFWITFSNTRQIWKRKNLPKSTTCTFHIVFLQITMYSYTLQNLRQLDNSFRHRSNNTFHTFFRKDFHFWFRYGVLLSSLIFSEIRKDQLPKIKL